MKAALIAAAFLTASNAGAAEVARPGAKLYGDATRGKEIADRWCVECHVRGQSVDDRVPSLSALARGPSRSEGATRTFLMQPHPPMPPLELSTQQIEDILAFLRSLPPPAAPKASP